MARRRSSRRRAARRTSRRVARRSFRRTSRRGFTAAPRAKLGDYLLTIGAGVAGAIGSQYAIDKWAPKEMKEGDGRIAAKAVLAGASLFASRKVRGKAGKHIATGAGLGIGFSTGLDLVARFAPKEEGQKGLGQGFSNQTPGGFSGTDAMLAAEAARLGIQ